MFWKMEYNLNSGPKLEDDLNVLANERRPQLFWKMEDNFNIFGKMEDDPNSKLNGRLPKF